MNARYTVISCLHITVIYACIVHMDHRSYCMSYFCMYILVFLLHDCFSLLIFSLLDMSVCWYAMCETKCYMDLSHGATSRIPHLLYIIFRYLISWYQQSSCPMIVLLVPCTVLVLDILCSSNIMNITWGWERLDSWLGLVGWMSGSIVSPTAGDVVGLATVCIVLFLAPVLAVALVSAARGLFKAVVPGMHVIHPPD